MKVKFLKNGTKQQIRLAPMWVSVFTDILGFTLILPFLYYFASNYTDNTALIGVLISSNAIFGIFFGPLLAKLSDKFGRKPLLLISQAGTILGFILLAFSNSIEMMFAARIIDGIFGGQFPIAKAVIGDVVPPKDRAKQMTNIGLSFTLASLIGPGTGSLLFKEFGIIGPGLAATAMSIFTMIFTAISYKETLPLKTGIEEPWHKMTATSISSGKIIHNRKAVYLLVVYGFIALLAQLFQGSLAIFGAKHLDLEATDIGILFTIMGVFQVFFRVFLFGRIRKWVGDTKTSVIGLGTFILTYVLLLFVDNKWQLIVILIMMSFSGATSRGIILGFTSRVVDHLNQGKINGLSTSLDNLSQIIGPILGGALLSFPNAIPFILTLVALSIVPFTMDFGVLKFKFEEEDRMEEDKLKVQDQVTSHEIE